MQRSISVVIGSLNRRDYLELTLKTLRQELAAIPGPHEIFVVDGGSTDGTVEWLITQKDVISIIQHNRGEWLGQKIQKQSWGYFMNLGFKAATGKYILMLSDDCLVVPGAIQNGLKQFEEQLKTEKLGAIAFYWRNWPDMKNYWIGKTLGGRIFVNHGMYLREALENVGYIDEDNYHFYCGDGDLCLKIWKAGYTVQESENSYIEHFMESTPEIRKENNVTYSKDWGNYLSRWAGVYGTTEPEANTWVYREFHDESETCKLFMKPSTTNFARAVAKSKLRGIRDLVKSLR